jgi:diguanylate cyclase (GGDEF)-like protein
VDQHPEPSEDGTTLRMRSVGGLLVACVLGALAIVTIASPQAGQSDAVRVVLGVATAVIALTLAGLALALRGAPGWTRAGGPVALGVALTALAGLLHVGMAGEAVGTLFVAFAVSCLGYLVRDRRELLVTIAVVWAFWVLAGGLALAAGTATVNGHAGAWLIAAGGIVLALIPSYVTLAARDRESSTVRAAHDRAAEVAVIDHLTGVANRQGLAMIAGPMIENARRQGQAVHCLYIDLEEFRTVNEAAGWSAGDALLAAAAEALRGSTRLTDVVARWSADEFVVLGPGTGTSPLEMERRVRKRLTSECPVPAQVWTPRVSVGSSTLVPWDEGNLEDLTRRADEDMHLRRSLRRRTRVAGRPLSSDGAGQEGGTAPAVG